MYLIMRFLDEFHNYMQPLIQERNQLIDEMDQMLYGAFCILF
jgi:hypothetical protein